jgi:hypothetical protein
MVDAHSDFLGRRNPEHRQCGSSQLPGFQLLVVCNPQTGKTRPRRVVEEPTATTIVVGYIQYPRWTF